LKKASASGRPEIAFGAFDSLFVTRASAGFGTERTKNATLGPPANKKTPA
jgi:hypothetical protein